MLVIGQPDRLSKDEEHKQLLGYAKSLETQMGERLIYNPKFRPVMAEIFCKGLLVKSIEVCSPARAAHVTPPSRSAGPRPDTPRGRALTPDEPPPAGRHPLRALA